MFVEGLMDLKAQIMRDEGLRLKVYIDSLGHPTIGFGRALDVQGISLAEAELMLDNDILEYRAGVLSRLPWSATLDEPRLAVLVGMAFNLGLRGLLGFRRMLEAAERGDWPAAATEMLDSRWATQVPVRAGRLALQMQTGKWDGAG